MKLIAGLGNIGDKYKYTRHNIGFEVLDYLNSKLDGTFTKFEDCAYLSKVNFENEKLLICKPSLFMNNSGIAIRKIKDYFKIDNKNIFVIFDDCSLPFAKLRIRMNGSSGGHNGIKSIIENLGGQQDFPRLKIGIGNNNNIELSDFVLGKFTKEEMSKFDDICKISTEIILKWIKDPSEKNLQQFNNYQII
jgi:peptidyl-tRNA hydrolase, PTH1 family